MEERCNGYNLLSYSTNHIDVEARLPGAGLLWRCTGFYGIADQSQRWRTWNLLRHLAGQRQLPRIVGGDCNEILSNDEKSGGIDRGPNLITQFREALQDCSLSDIGFEGDLFTWSNNRRHPNTVRC